jgi:uncharacterized protein (TIGR02266 family)
MAKSDIDKSHWRIRLRGMIHRKEPRAQVSLRITYAEPSGKHHETFTTHVGGGGCFIVSTRPPSEGTPLHLEFTLPTHPKAIHVGGKVAWRRTEYQAGCPAGIGVAFQNLSSDDKEVIRQYIDEVLSRKI